MYNLPLKVKAKRGDFIMEEKIPEYISAIEKNFPPENYTILREALSYCIELLKEKNESLK